MLEGYPRKWYSSGFLDDGRMPDLLSQMFEATWPTATERSERVCPYL